ncbi:MAG: hypothetical protein ISS29_01945 [Candidatus Marinimicrobia bacterium]|nr:hypothetical protein [Candidatus Neomarinimicrobiota bacterium]
MTKETAIKLFNHQKISTRWDADEEQWYFSVVDVVGVLTDSVNSRDYWFKMKIRVKSEDRIELSTICRQLKMQAAGAYWRKLKQRLAEEGSKVVTLCHGLKLEAPCGKMPTNLPVLYFFLGMNIIVALYL